MVGLLGFQASAYDNPQVLEKLALLEKHDPEHFPTSKVLAMLETEILMAKKELADWESRHDPQLIRKYFESEPLEIRLIEGDRPDIIVKRVGNDLFIRTTESRGTPAASHAWKLDPLNPKSAGTVWMRTIEELALAFAKQPCPYAKRAAATPRELLAEGRRIAAARDEEVGCGNRWRARFSIETVSAKLTMTYLQKPGSDPERSIYPEVARARLVLESLIAGEEARQGK